MTIELGITPIQMKNNFQNTVTLLFHPSNPVSQIEFEKFRTI